MLSQSTMAVVDRYWSGVLGCPLDRPDAARTVVQALPTGREGVGLFLRERLLIVSLSEQWLTDYRRLAERWTTCQVWQPERVRAEMDGLVGTGIGPAFVGYTETGLFRAETAGRSEGEGRGEARQVEVRMLTAADASAVAGLRTACDPAEWEHGGSYLAHGPVVGVFVAGQLVSLAGCEIWGQAIAHICIVSHPRYRGRGCGSLAVSRLTQEVLERGLVPQCRTLDANGPSMGIAGRLRFERYATTVWYRPVRADTPKA